MRVSTDRDHCNFEHIACPISWSVWVQASDHAKEAQRAWYFVSSVLQTPVRSIMPTRKGMRERGAILARGRAEGNGFEEGGKTTLIEHKDHPANKTAFEVADPRRGVEKRAVRLSGGGRMMVCKGTAIGLIRMDGHAPDQGPTRQGAVTELGQPQWSRSTKCEWAPGTRLPSSTSHCGLCPVLDPLSTSH